MTQTNDPPTVLDIGLIPNSNEKADLDAPSGTGGKLVIGQAPNITITETTVVADAAERLALDVQDGDIAIQTNVSSSFIFTGGDNVANNWETLDFDAVGAIDGESINPSGIAGANLTNATAGNTLTATGSGNLTFAPAGGIQEVSTFSALGTPSPPEIAYVTDEDAYYKSQAGGIFNINEAQFIQNGINGLFFDCTFNDTGTKFYGGDDNNVRQVSLGNPFDLSTGSVDGTFVANMDNANFCEFNGDGTEFTILAQKSRFGRRFSLSTPYEITSGVSQIAEFNAPQGPLGGEFLDSGNKLVIQDRQDDLIFEFSLSTPFHYETRSLNFTLDISGDTPAPRPTDIKFTPNGEHMFVLNQQEGVSQYDLTTPFDISTATFFGFLSLPAAQFGLGINDTGTRIFVNDNNAFQIFEVGTAQEWTDI